MSWLVVTLLGMFTFVIREISQKHALRFLDSLDFLAVRGLFILPMLIPFFFFISFDFPWFVWILCLLVAIIAALAFDLKNAALKHIDISLFKPLSSTGPLFVVLFSFIILQDAPSWGQMVGILLIVFGTYLLKLKKGTNVIDPFIALIKSQYQKLVLLSALLLGLSVTLDKLIVDAYTDPITYLVIIWGMLSVMFIFWSKKRNHKQTPPLLKLARKHAGKVFIPAFLTILLHVFFYQALSMAYAGAVVSIFKTEALFTTLLGGMIFKEKQLMQKAGSCIVIVLGAILVALF